MNVYARILALGAYQPARVVTNDELSRTLDTDDEWIRSRVGIVSRRIAAPGETVVDMAVAAGGKALAASGLAPGDIGLVIVATCSQETQIPNAAAAVAYRLGITAAGAYDVNAACAGFCYALASARDAVGAGSARNVLVIGAEKMSAWLDWSDRNTSILFGDGAGAAVVGAGAGAGSGAGSGQPGAIGPVVWGSAGGLADKIRVATRDSLLTQDGQQVFWWAVNAMHPVARDACRRAGVDPTELAAFVPHQANLRIVHGIARKLGAPQAVVADDIVESGNTSAASIPIALAHMVEAGRIPPGGRVLLLGFGAGLTYAGQVITVP